MEHSAAAWRCLLLYVNKEKVLLIWRRSRGSRRDGSCR